MFNPKQSQLARSPKSMTPDAAAASSWIWALNIKETNKKLVGLGLISDSSEEASSHPAFELVELSLALLHETSLRPSS